MTQKCELAEKKRGTRDEGLCEREKLAYSIGMLLNIQWVLGKSTTRKKCVNLQINKD